MNIERAPLDDAEVLALKQDLFVPTVPLPPESVALKATDDVGRFLGFAFYAVLEATRATFIPFVGVVQAFAHQGVGRALVQRVESIARVAGAPEITALIDPQNIVALRAFRRYGFVPVTQVKAFRVRVLLVRKPLRTTPHIGAVRGCGTLRRRVR